MAWHQWCPVKTPKGKKKINDIGLPSTELTYPTLGKGKSSSKLTFEGDMLVPRRVHDTKLPNSRRT